MTGSMPIGANSVTPIAKAPVASASNGQLNRLPTIFKTSMIDFRAPNGAGKLKLCPEIDRLGAIDNAATKHMFYELFS
jgi:predicted NUDIX family NTP pyrophosphohydrolase